MCDNASKTRLDHVFSESPPCAAVLEVLNFRWSRRHTRRESSLLIHMSRRACCFEWQSHHLTLIVNVSDCEFEIMSRQWRHAFKAVQQQVWHKKNLIRPVITTFVSRRIFLQKGALTPQFLLTSIRSISLRHNHGTFHSQYQSVIFYNVCPTYDVLPNLYS